MSHHSNGSSSLVNGQDNGYQSGHSNGLDFEKIGFTCLEGLKEASNDLKDMSERCNSLEQSVAEKLGEIDLRVSAVETSQQAQATLANDNQTLKQSIQLLSKSVDPTWKSGVQSRIHQQELEMKKLQEQVATLSHLLESNTVSANRESVHQSQSSISTSSSRHSQVHPSGLVASTTSEHCSPPRADAMSRTLATPIRSAPSVTAATLPPTFDKEAVERALAKKAELEQPLKACLAAIQSLAEAPPSDVGMDDVSIAEASVLSQIDCKCRRVRMFPVPYCVLKPPILPVSVPLVPRTSYEHKRDWVHAWQQALGKLQDDISKSATNVARRASQLHAREQQLAGSQQAIFKAGSTLKEAVTGLQEECALIADVKAMQEDHELESKRRLDEVILQEESLREREMTILEREDIIKQDEYIISNKGKRQYERDAADFRRVQVVRDLRNELHHRIEKVMEIEQQLMRDGLSKGRVSDILPRLDDLPEM